jgi:hypothetical protein
MARGGEEGGVFRGSAPLSRVGRALECHPHPRRQNYFLGWDPEADGVHESSWDHELLSAMIANVGFCVQPDTRCERDY